MEQNIVQNEIDAPDTHYFVYKNKKYPIKFVFFQYSSNYFLKNKKELKKDQQIQLFDSDNLFLSDESIQTFVNFVQLVPISITNDNVVALNQLAKKYEVYKLIKITNDYITEHHLELALPILLSNQNDPTFQAETYENIIARQFQDYINDDRLLTLQIPFLYRIIEIFSKDEKKRQKTGTFLIDFLFKCLDKYGREASVLFQFADFGDSRSEYLNRLFGRYHSIFDFHFINLEFTKSLYENQNQLINKNENFEQILMNQNQSIEKLRNEIDQLNNMKCEIKKLQEEIASMKLDHEKQQNDQKLKEDEKEKNCRKKSIH